MVKFGSHNSRNNDKSERDLGSGKILEPLVSKAASEIHVSLIEGKEAALAERRRIRRVKELAYDSIQRDQLVLKEKMKAFLIKEKKNLLDLIAELEDEVDLLIADYESTPGDATNTILVGKIQIVSARIEAVWAHLSRLPC